MSKSHHTQDIKNHWDRDGLSQAIRDALIASGKSLDALTIDDLTPLDQFHRGSKGFTSRLARLANLKSGMKVLDVGGGLGGPARTLAVEFGCHVTVMDIAESYVLAGGCLLISCTSMIASHIKLEVLSSFPLRIIHLMPSGLKTLA